MRTTFYLFYPFSILGCVRPSDGRSVRPSVTCFFRCQKWTIFSMKIIGAVQLWHCWLCLRTHHCIGLVSMPYSVHATLSHLLEDILVGRSATFCISPPFFSGSRLVAAETLIRGADDGVVDLERCRSMDWIGRRPGWSNAITPFSLILILQIDSKPLGCPLWKSEKKTFLSRYLVHILLIELRVRSTPNSRDRFTRLVFK